VAEEPGRVERATIASWEGMRRSEKAKVSEEAVRRKGGGGGPMEWRTKDGEAEEPARVAGASAAGREGTRRSEKAKVSEEALLTRSSKAKKPMNALVHTYTLPEAGIFSRSPS